MSLFSSFLMMHFSQIGKNNHLSGNYVIKSLFRTSKATSGPKLKPVFCCSNETILFCFLFLLQSKIFKTLYFSSGLRLLYKHPSFYSNTTKFQINVLLFSLINLGYFKVNCSNFFHLQMGQLLRPFILPFERQVAKKKEKSIYQQQQQKRERVGVEWKKSSRVGLQFVIKLKQCSKLQNQIDGKISQPFQLFKR